VDFFPDPRELTDRCNSISVNVCLARREH
jgi:hypothetical protein